MFILQTSQGTTYMKREWEIMNMNKGQGIKEGVTPQGTHTSSLLTF
jgi:hypothetical protein